MPVALAIVTTAALAAPSLATAEDVPVHLVPAPANGATSPITGSIAMSTVGGLTMTCKSLKGTVTWENGTTGHLQLSLENCSASGMSCSDATTAVLPFHLLTLPNKVPGRLITPGASGGFVSFVCGFTTVRIVGNGLIGTVTKPTCGAQSNSLVVRTEAAAGAQKHKLVEGTATNYHLSAQINPIAFEEEAAVESEETISFTEAESSKKLECT